MSVPAANLPFPKNDLKSNPLTVFVHGRIDKVQKLNSKDGEVFWSHCIRTPAKDEYSMPGYVDVTFSKKLGSVGDDLEGLCEVSGIPNSFNAKDSEGQAFTRYTANIYLRYKE